MSKKIKVLISVLIVTLLLTLGTTLTVMAEEAEDPTTTETSENSLLERVADILGIDEDTLLDAFEQARKEMAADAFADRLDEAVEAGLIDQEQADEILEWWAERPDEAIRQWRGQEPGIMGPGMFRHGFRSRLSPRFGFRFRDGFREGFCPGLFGEAD